MSLLEALHQIRNITESLDYEDGDLAGRMLEQEKSLDAIREIAYAMIAQGKERSINV